MSNTLGSLHSLSRLPTSSTAKAPPVPNKPDGEGGTHASVQDGVIYLLDFGVYGPVSRWEAVGVLGEIDRSRDHKTMERARQIRAALIATDGEDYSFRAPRHGDLVVCPYCDPSTFSCDHCGGERRLYASEVFNGQCDNPLPPLTGGLGGKTRSPATNPLYTMESPTRGSSRSAGSPTAIGRKVPSSRPASGGSRRSWTQEPANSSALKSCAPKSMAAAPTRGETGHG